MLEYLKQISSFFRPNPPLSFNPEKISSNWFRSHYAYAAETVIDWLGSELDFNSKPTLLDFGCGGAITTLGMALRFPNSTVIGVDVVDKFKQLPELAKTELDLSRMPDNLHLHLIKPAQAIKDIYPAQAIFSWSVFEHIVRDDIPVVMADLYALLPPGGLFFLQIEPLYFSPWGSHLQSFVDTPWAHLLWSEEKLRTTVLNHSGEIAPHQRGHNYRSMSLDNFKKFHLSAFDSLNQCTADEITTFLRSTGFDILKEKRKEIKLAIPDELLNHAKASDLLTNELLVLARKP